MSHYEHIDDLIVKVLSGEANEQERAVVEKFRREQPKAYDDAVWIFNRTAQITDAPSFDTDEAWEKVHSKITQGAQRKKGILRTLTRIGAVAAIAIIGAVMWWLYATPEVELQTASHVEKVVLEDQSNIVLDSESHLSYRYNQRKGEMTVELTGSAQFNLDQKTTAQWVLEAGGLTIRDIGTVFTVIAKENNDTVFIKVESGEVAVTKEGIAERHFVAGDQGVFIKSKQTWIAETTDFNDSFVTRQFEFDGVPLAQVVKTLNSVYDEQIKLGNTEIEQCLIFTTIDNESFEEVVQLIAETLGLEVKLSPKEAVLSGTCD